MKRPTRLLAAAGKMDRLLIAFAIIPARKTRKGDNRGKGEDNGLPAYSLFSLLPPVQLLLPKGE
jgi:hypothetical protein